jgi:hypothetical protein
VEATIAGADRARHGMLTLHIDVSHGHATQGGRARTGTGAHLSALAPEPARTLFLPLLSHPER